MLIISASIFYSAPLYDKPVRESVVSLRIREYAITLIATLRGLLYSHNVVDSIVRGTIFMRFIVPFGKNEFSNIHTYDSFCCITIGIAFRTKAGFYYFKHS